MTRIHVAIGPISPRASWQWLGPHLAESLADSCTVHFFRDGNLPRADVVIFIKERPAVPLQQAYARACQIIYMPVDYYRSRAQLEADAPFLQQCAGLLVHSRRLGALLARYNSTVWQVDHPNRYGLAHQPPYRADGYLLWIGDFLNLPHLLRWRETVALPYELKVLTNVRHTSIGGVAMTLALAHRLGVELDVSASQVNGLPLFEWDAGTQRRMMESAKAALDIKGGEEDFYQFTKPPTKGQQFIVSGIPFAANATSAITEDLLESGFAVADVADQQRWFSHAYWQSTRDFSAVLEQRIHPQTVALAYRRCLQQALDRKPSGTARSVGRGSSVPASAAGHGLLAYARALRVLHRLHASWQDTAPKRVKWLLEMCRVHVPGYVACRPPAASANPEPPLLSVLPDLASESTSGWGPNFTVEIPGSWEIISAQSPPSGSGGARRFKSIRRWPFRGVLRDRMLAASHADGRYLAFIPFLDDGAIAWIGQALAALEKHPETALLRRDREAGADPDTAASFVVRSDVWRALRGYHPGVLLASPRCAEVDLLQRVRLLGYGVEAASDTVVQHSLGADPRLRGGGDAVVYTAITQGYDRLQPLGESRVKPACQVAFLDQATRSLATSKGDWELCDIDSGEHDPIRQAKLHKVRPELFFPEARYSLWIDGNVSLIYPFDLQRLIDQYLADADLCIGRHYARSCVYQEAEACKQRGLDAAELIDRQMARYRQEGFPERYGLNEAVVILRRHSAAVGEFNRLWWQEICQGSRRDQLSFNYVQWKTGLPLAEFPLPIQYHNGLFAKCEHAQHRPLKHAAGPLLGQLLRRMEGFHFDVS